MSMGIRVRGSMAHGMGNARELLTAIGSWLNERCADELESPVSIWEGEGEWSVIAELHPCAEALTITLDSEGDFEITARTTSAGPGYHEYVTELVDGFADRFGVLWATANEGSEYGDSTGYIKHRDRAALETSMVRWLGEVATRLTHEEHADESIAISMSVDHQFDAGSMIVTPLGPRSREWARSTASHPAASVGFFAWWERRSASVHLNRAIARMWASIRWMRPRTEDEERAIMLTLRDLASAWEQDPELAYPWREWVELARISPQEVHVPEKVHQQAIVSQGSKIGYRRRPVRVLLAGGWNIRVPGGFSETFEDEGGYLAWDESRNVRVSSFTAGCCDDPAHEHEIPTSEEMLSEDDDPALPSAVEVLERWERDDLMGTAKIFQDEEEGVKYWIVMGKVAGVGRLALCTVCYEDAEDRAWAIETVQSLR